MTRVLTALAIPISLSVGVGCDDDDDDDDFRSRSCPRIGAIDVGEPLADTKFIIEHNATDEDTGFQVFADGEPWDRLELVGPGGELLLSVHPRGALNRGITELFFETAEPENESVPIPELLADFREGTYKFTARSAEEGTAMIGNATLSHDIPAGPVITAPADESIVDSGDVVVTWNQVSKSILGSPVAIVGYQLIVELDQGDVAFPGFSKQVLSVHVPPTTTSVTIPPEFLLSEESYDIEVLALEVSGNQTLSSISFETR